MIQISLFDRSEGISPKGMRNCLWICSQKCEKRERERIQRKRPQRGREREIIQKESDSNNSTQARLFMSLGKKKSKLEFVTNSAIPQI